jgi:nicotinamide-nucleotide amidase
VSAAVGTPASTEDVERAIDATVVQLADALRAAGLHIATAESCTGGLIAGACTTIAGSSDWFERGFVTYSNEAKTEMLGVDAASIAAHGAVSEEVARAMASGALAHARAQLAVAVTGIAGPGGGSRAKPVGTVWLALASSDPARGVRAELLQLHGDRRSIRAQTVLIALERLLAAARGA